MKRLILTTIALVVATTSWAQGPGSYKKVENNFLIGTGLFGETGNRAQRVFPGAVLRLCSARSVTISLRKEPGWL